MHSGGENVFGTNTQTGLYKEWQPQKCGNCKGNSCPSGSRQYTDFACAAGICPRKVKCTWANPNMCAVVGGNDGNIRFPQTRSTTVECSYKNSDFKTEADIEAYIVKFDITNDLNDRILPYFCQQDDNAVTPTCTQFCFNRWSTDSACAYALEQYCSRDDNAVNDDFCYARCANPEDDIRPAWCDTQMTNVCRMIADGDDGKSLKLFGISMTPQTSILLVLFLLGILYIYFFIFK